MTGTTLAMKIKHVDRLMTAKLFAIPVGLLELFSGRVRLLINSFASTETVVDERKPKARIFGYMGLGKPFSEHFLDDLQRELNTAIEQGIDVNTVKAGEVPISYSVRIKPNHRLYQHFVEALLQSDLDSFLKSLYAGDYKVYEFFAFQKFVHT